VTHEMLGISPVMKSLFKCLLMAKFHCVRTQGKALKSARSELEQATQQKVGALLQLSDAQMAGGRAEDRAERAGRLVDGLRAQLDQVRCHRQV